MANDHPEITELLLWQSGELSADRIAAVEQHVSGCSVCQAQLSEIDFLKENVVEIHTAATQLNLQAALKERTWRRWPGGFLPALTSSQTWMAATASVLIVALLLFTLTDLTPAARAETLLSKAAEQESSSPEPHFFEFEIGGAQYPYTLGIEARQAAGGASFSEIVMAGFHAAGWHGGNPLSAKSFLEWRKSLRQKHDALHSISGATEVTTSTTEGPIRKAMLRIRSSDHHPIAGEFEFSEATHLAPVTVVETGAPSMEIAASPVHVLPHPEKPSAPAPLAPVDPLDKTEAAVRLELHKSNQDGNVLLAVQREPSEIKVWGAVPSAAEARLNAVLAGLPGVQLAVSAQPQSASALPFQPYLGDTTPLGNDQLQALYPNDLNGRQAFLNGIDALTRRIVGEAKTRDGLIVLAGRMRGSSDAAGLHQAIADVQAEMVVDLTQLRTKLQPFIGTVAGQPHPLSYPQAMQLYTLVHEVLFLSRSQEQLTLEGALDRMRPLFSGK